MVASPSGALVSVLVSEAEVSESVVSVVSPLPVQAAAEISMSSASAKADSLLQVFFIIYLPIVT